MARRRQPSLRQEEALEIISIDGNIKNRDEHFNDFSATHPIDTSNTTSSSPSRFFKVSPSTTLKGAFGRGAAGSNSTGPNRRSDSLALSEAEGGAFKVTAPLLDTAHSHSPRFATSFPPARVSMPVILRNWSAKRILFVLIVGFVFFTLILSPTRQRDEVLSQANKAWDKAEDYWDGIRNSDLASSNDPPPIEHLPKVPMKPIASTLDLDQEPHVINIPPMQAGKEIKQSSILEAVRQKPALHANPEKTTRCESNGGKILDWRGTPRPVVQYAIMIDAGSTGSRVHVYKFNFCTSSPELEDEVFQMIQGGLSSYKEDARGAALSLKPLLETALKSVPASLQRCTPIAVKATAGLRLLGPESSSKILQSVRTMLETEYPFPIADEGQSGKQNGIEIMEGKDEGVFAWITVNYLLNRIGSDGESTTSKAGGNAKGVKTAAVMDLGGASTQIVFEPVYEDDKQGMYPGEHVYELSNFGGKKYTLYQNSYLGYGLMEARKSINSLSFFTYGLTHPTMVRLGEPPKALTGQASSSSFEGIKVPSPCFAEGKEKKTAIRTQGSKEQVDVTMVGTAGGYEACKRLVEVMMDKDA